MDDAVIGKIQEELTKDIYELSTSHKEEITKLMEDYDDHHMAATMQLDAYETKFQQQKNQVTWRRGSISRQIR